MTAAALLRRTKKNDIDRCSLRGRRILGDKKNQRKVRFSVRQNLQRNSSHRHK